MHTEEAMTTSYSFTEPISPPPEQEAQRTAEKGTSESVSEARRHFRAAVHAVQFSNNYTRMYPDFAAADRAGRIQLLRHRYDELEHLKHGHEKVRKELEEKHELERKSLIASEEASSERLKVLHKDQHQEKDIMAATQKYEEKTKRKRTQGSRGTTSATQ